MKNNNSIQLRNNALHSMKQSASTDDRKVYGHGGGFDNRSEEGGGGNGGYRDRFNEEDDDLVQRSSILSYQEDSNQGGKHCPGGRLGQVLAGVLGQCQDGDINDEEDCDDPKSALSSLKNAIAELYLSIKQKTRDENEATSVDEEAEERDIILSLDSYVIIEYIKSSVDIILNLKFEEIEKRLLDKNISNDNEMSEDQMGRTKSKKADREKHGNMTGGSHEQVDTTIMSNSERSSTMSQLDRDGPPQVYEELIQSLEGDIRKHIRIEQQLKLHIESMENRIEELENINEKMEGEASKASKSNSKSTKDQEQRIKELEGLLKKKEEVGKTYEVAMRGLKDNEIKLRSEVEQLKKMHTLDHNAVLHTKMMDPFSIIQGFETNGRNQEGGGQVMNKTQPVNIKQHNMSQSDQQQQQQLNIHHMRRIQQQTHDQFGSYSSCQSYVEGGSSPDRRTPDLTHPYLHATQIISKKKTAITPVTSSKPKKYMVPNSVVESIGLQPSFNSAISTYSNGQSGKGRVMGQRKLSSQQTRNSNQPMGMKTTVTKNSWIGQINNLMGGVVPVSGPNTAGLNGQQPQFSNIINNNIQGLSINYSNQIIQNPDPIQQYANANFIGIPSNNMGGSSQIQGTDESDSSNLNSHRRCKSQNVKRERAETATSIGKKSVEKKKMMMESSKMNSKSGLGKDTSYEELFVNHLTEIMDHPQGIRDHKNKSMGISRINPNQSVTQNPLEETASFDTSFNANNKMFKINESNRRMSEFHSDQVNNHQALSRIVMRPNGSQISNTISGHNTQKMRTASNRVQQNMNVAAFNQTPEDFGKNRFNQSYGGGVGIISTATTASKHHNRKQNMTGNAASQSLEKTSSSGITMVQGGTASRSRNNQGKNLTQQHHTVMGTGPISYQVNHTKFEGNNLIDLNFKTNITHHQSKNVSGTNNAATGNFSTISSKQQQNLLPGSTTNNSAFINQQNVLTLKQQLMASKKASNLLMKGLSPLKR